MVHLLLEEVHFGVLKLEEGSLRRVFRLLVLTRPRSTTHYLNRRGRSWCLVPVTAALIVPLVEILPALWTHDQGVLVVERLLGTCVLIRFPGVTTRRPRSALYADCVVTLPHDLLLW